MAQMDALALEAAEEVFGHGVVIGIALAGHALPDAEAGETLTVSVGGVLDAAVGVEDEAGQRLAAPDGHAEGGESEICVDAVGEGVADDLLCAKVFHNSAVEPALAGGDIGNIADCALPGFVDSKNEEKTERNAGYLVVSHSGGGMLRQGTRKGIRRTPANRGMRAHRIVKGLDISEDVCHGMCP